MIIYGVFAVIALLALAALSLTEGTKRENEELTGKAQDPNYALPMNADDVTPRGLG